MGKTVGMGSMGKTENTKHKKFAWHLKWTLDDAQIQLCLRSAPKRLLPEENFKFYHFFILPCN